MDVRRGFLLLMFGSSLAACKETCPSSGSASPAKPTLAKTLAEGSAPAAGAAPVSQCPTPVTPTEPPAAGNSDGASDSAAGSRDSSSAAPPPVIPDVPLLWEKSHPERKAWTDWTYHMVLDELATDFMSGADDVEDFCPRYQTLTNRQRANFWGMLVSAVTKFESGFDPLSRYREGPLGIDPVTGTRFIRKGSCRCPIKTRRTSGFCEFDWGLDKNLAADDPKKTIFDPQKNLSCGIRILARQIHRQHRIAVTKGVYWSVLIPGGRYTQVPAIQALTKKMKGCF